MTTTGILLLTSLLQLLLFHIPASSVHCEHVICRADNYYWLPLDHKGGVISPAPESEDWKCNRGLSGWPDPFWIDESTSGYLAKFRSSDGNIHVTVVWPNGTMALMDHRTEGKAELLMSTRPSQNKTGTAFFEVWPGTMLSKKGNRSPDLREAALVVGIEKNRPIYLGHPTIGKQYHFGKVTQNASGEYELIYHVGQVQRRTDDFYITVDNSCGIRLENRYLK